ncbi:MAG: hypothetical protein J6U01_12430 [Clostridia bacterium]|nr:hypothetical protein [Clostridia bacterium]
MSRKTWQLGMALMMAIGLMFSAAAAENAPETAFTIPEGLRTELGAPDLKVITEAPKSEGLAGSTESLPFGTSISGALSMKAAASPLYEGLAAEPELIEISPERLLNPDSLKDSGKGLLEGLGQFDPILFDKGQINP